MSQGQVLSVLQEALIVALMLSAPLLLISVLVGLVISIFQAATQVHEQTITFVPKIIAIAVILLAFGPWMMSVMQDYTFKIFKTMLDIMS